MSNLNHRGPDNLGPKTGMKLGKCRKTKSDTVEDSEIRQCRKGRIKKSHCNWLERLYHEENCCSHNSK